MFSVTLEERTERIGVRIAPTELAMLEAIIEATGLSASDVVRQLVRKEYKERFGDKLPKRRKR